MVPPASIRECRVPLSKRRWGAGLIGTFKDVDLIRQFCLSCLGIGRITANSQWKVLWEQLNICCIFLSFPMQAGAPQTTFNWCQDFLSFTSAAPITFSAALFYLAISPWEVCIPHLCSIVESSKPLFGSDTSSKGEVIPKLFSSQRTLVISSSKEINRFAFCCHFLFLAKICNHFLCKRSNRLLFLLKCLQIFWWKLIKPEIKRTKGMCTAYFFYFSVNEKSSKEICCT